MIEELFRNNHACLVRFLAKRLGGDIDRATDIAHEAYLRVIRYQQPETGSERVVEHARAFLYRVAKNVLADEQRRDKVRHAEAHVSVEKIEIADQGPGQDRILEARDELGAVEAAAWALPSRCREVFFLSRFEEMSHAEVAKKLGISISMVEQHMMRAMWEIRQNVRGAAAEPGVETGDTRLQK